MKALCKMGKVFLFVKGSDSYYILEHINQPLIIQEN